MAVLLSGGRHTRAQYPVLYGFAFEYVSISRTLEETWLYLSESNNIVYAYIYDTDMKMEHTFTHFNDHRLGTHSFKKNTSLDCEEI